MLDEKKVKEILESGKISLYDIDRDTDLMWAIADLYNIEKHLNMALNNLASKLSKNQEDKKLRIAFEALCGLLNEVRKHRAKHLKHIEKLKLFSAWCNYKHFLGAMMQFGEVASKEIYMGNLERARECFETSQFCFEAIMFLNMLAKKLEKEEKEGDECGDISKKERS